MSRPAMRNYMLVFTGCVLFHVVGTWSLPLIDRDEPRFAEGAREMRQRDDFVIPYFNNQFRFDKPPLTYWWQIASYRLFGESDFAARFPTVIGASLVAVVLMAWGSRLGEVGAQRGHGSAAGTHGSYNGNGYNNVSLSEADAGWWAPIIFTLCLQTFIHGKAAVADMWLVLFVTLAHWASWELLRANAEKKFFWMFYVSLATAFLAKGPIGWVPLLTVATVLCSRWLRPAGAATRSVAARFHFVPGILLMLALVCVWGIPALVRTHGEFFAVGIGKHVVSRSLATMEGHGANSFGAYVALLPFYFVTVFVSLFPWSIKLPALCKNLRVIRDATDAFLLVGVLIIFGIFTLVKTKLPHYTLPAFPLLALLMARRAQQLNLSGALARATAAVFLLVALAAPPMFSNLVPSYNLARQSRAELRPEMEFGAVEYTEPSLVWYFRRSVSGFMTSLQRRDAAGYLAKPGPRFVIVPTASIPRAFPVIDTSWRTYRARGWNMAKGERVDVTMLLRPE